MSQKGQIKNSIKHIFRIYIKYIFYIYFDLYVTYVFSFWHFWNTRRVPGGPKSGFWPLKNRLRVPEGPMGHSGTELVFQKGQNAARSREKTINIMQCAGTRSI